VTRDPRLDWGGTGGTGDGHSIWSRTVFSVRSTVRLVGAPDRGRRICDAGREIAGSSAAGSEARVRIQFHRRRMRLRGQDHDPGQWCKGGTSRDPLGHPKRGRGSSRDLEVRAPRGTHNLKIGQRNIDHRDTGIRRSGVTARAICAGAARTADIGLCHQSQGQTPNGSSWQVGDRTARPCWPFPKKIAAAILIVVPRRRAAGATPAG